MNHFLIVDDSAVDRELMRGLIERRPEYHAAFASNGLEAIEHLEQQSPLAVITDLQMPEMNGLELVQFMRRRFPSIPVILLTAHGSEETALQALVAGAADYVPKHRAAKDLLRVLESVLQLCGGHWRHSLVTHFLRYKALHYEIDSNVEHIPMLVDQVQQAVIEIGVVEASERLQLAQCLAEALRNAIHHGSGSAEAVPSRVQVEVELMPQQATFRVRDEGRGFDTASLKDPRQSPDQLTGDSGRGLVLMRLFMDEVRFNAVGNEITLVKRRTNAAG
jgi:CheY-like chemotaxis protein